MWLQTLRYNDHLCSHRFVKACSSSKLSILQMLFIRHLCSHRIVLIVCLQLYYYCAHRFCVINSFHGKPHWHIMHHLYATPSCNSYHLYAHRLDSIMWYSIANQYLSIHLTSLLSDLNSKIDCHLGTRHLFLLLSLRLCIIFTFHSTAQWRAISGLVHRTILCKPRWFLNKGLKSMRVLKSSVLALSQGLGWVSNYDALRIRDL